MVYRRQFSRTGSGWFAGVSAALLTLGLLGVSPASASDKQSIDRPFPITVEVDGQALRGEARAYDGDGLYLKLDGEDEGTRHVAWDKLKPRMVYQVHRRVMDPTQAKRWLELGRLLLDIEGGDRFARKALKRAARLDESLSDRAEQLMPDASEGQADGGEQRRQGRAGGNEPDGAQERGVGGAGNDAERDADEYLWAETTKAEQKQAIEQLNRFAQEGLKKVGIEMRHDEGQYFLLYTNLPLEEARHWAGLLKKMYNRLCEMFAIPRGTNIWHGKALLMIFNSRDGYNKFETKIHGQPAGQSIGKCWQFSDGDVHINFFRQPDKYEFAQVLVHESVHGFLHRYRSKQRIPVWINEGLAETIAQRLVPQGEGVKRKIQAGLRMAKQRGDAGNIFDKKRLAPWQYGVVCSVTKFMIEKNKQGYVKFIKGIKDGLAWRESLKKHYGTTPTRLMRAWGAAHGIENMTP